ncbi:MAG: DNA-binding response OmpR family regulator [Bacteriovoracaceae bacterium]|jgi:DNA-binding response OmpR family regulator
MDKILIVEDDQSLGDSLQKYLSDENFEVTWAKSLGEAREASIDDFKLVILDWMLPDGQGIDFLKELRGEGNKQPIIMLTARTDLIDKVIGLESGASDYITKPFEPRELVARVRVQIRDKVESQSDAIKTDEVLNLRNLVIDSIQRIVTVDDKQLDFTKMEFDFLKLLAESPNRAFSREEILNKVWGYENYPTTRTVDTHVLQIRQKIGEEWIETVRGIGYRLKFEQ